MIGVPSELWGLLRQAFIEVESLQSNRQLRTFFDRASLRPWKFRMPKADVVQVRADRLISFLAIENRAYQGSGEWYDGQNLLVIFLVELGREYRKKDDVPPSVVALYQALQAKRVPLLS